MRGERMRNWAFLVLMCVVVPFSSGFSYLRYRLDDGLEMIDLGVTITKEPQIGLYWNSLDVFPVGYCNIDGTFVGWGGGQIGATPVHSKCWGFGYGREEIGWGDFDKNYPKTLYVDYSGVLGVILPPYRNEPATLPLAYTSSLTWATSARCGTPDGWKSWTSSSVSPRWTSRVTTA